MGPAVKEVTDPSTAWHCDFCERSFTTFKGRELHMAQWCKENPDAGGAMSGRTKKPAPRDVPDDFDSGETAPVDPEGSIFDEAPPERPPWRNRFWGGAKDAKPKIVAPPGERRPRTRRKPTDGVWATLWTVIGAGLVRTGADVPVGNCMTFQAPVVGGIFDEAIKGTFIDTLIQPIAGSGDRLKKVSAVVSMPVLVGVMERSPNSAAMLEPLLRQVIREHLTAMAPVIKAQRKQEVEYRKALDEMGIEQGEDPVNDVIAAIWSGMPVAEPEPAMNGHSAGRTDGS